MNALHEWALRHFLLLDRNQQVQAIRRLITCGMNEDAVAAATGLSVEQVCRILSGRVLLQSSREG